MIRINLLKKEAKKAKRKPKLAITPSKTTKQLGFVGIFLLAALIVGFLWFDITGQKDKVRKDINEATRKLDRLVKVEKVKEKSERLAREKKNLENHLNALNNLRDNQRSPLYPLTHIFWALQNHKDISLVEIVETSGEGTITYVLKGEGSIAGMQQLMSTITAFKVTRNIDFPKFEESKNTFELPIHFYSRKELEKSLGQQEAKGGME